MQTDWTPERRARLKELTAETPDNLRVMPLAKDVRSALAEIDRLEAHVAALAEERDRLAGALPDPEKLMNLALWFDLKDAADGKEGEDEVQQDLRRWAHAGRRALAALNPTKSEKSK